MRPPYSEGSNKLSLKNTARIHRSTYTSSNAFCKLLIKSRSIYTIQTYYTDQKEHKRHKQKKNKKTNHQCKTNTNKPNKQNKQKTKTRTKTKSQTMLSMIEETGGKRCCHRAAFPFHRDTEHLWKRWQVMVKGQMPSL